jgi:Ice-binding-like
LKPAASGTGGARSPGSGAGGSASHATYNISTHCRNFTVLGGSSVIFGSTTNIISSGLVGVSSVKVAAVATGTIISGTFISKNGAVRASKEPSLQCAKELVYMYRNDSTLICQKSVAAELSGLTLGPGVYCPPKGTFTIAPAGTITLDAHHRPNATWIFQMTGNFTVGASSKVLLLNGAKASHIYWVTGSNANIGGSSALQGNILAQKSIFFGQSSTLTGRALSMAEVHFYGRSTVTLPAKGALGHRYLKEEIGLGGEEDPESDSSPDSRRPLMLTFGCVALLILIAGCGLKSAGSLLPKGSKQNNRLWSENTTTNDNSSIPSNPSDSPMSRAIMV